MKPMLKVLFAAIFVTMAAVTVRTSLRVSLWDALPGLMQDPWAVATLWDAYFAFLTFYLWLAYKERRTVSRIVWFVLVMGLGSIAMSLYVLIQLSRLKPEEPAWAVLGRNE
jgi:hypothetical protein